MTRRADGGRRWKAAVAALVVAAFALRLWGVEHGLPFVYNIDESANFVPSAVGFFSGDYDPHYFTNPPAFSYLLHIVFAFWFGDGWPFGAREAASDAYAIDPKQVFVIARVTTAFLGAAGVWLVCATGSRLYDRRVGLVAGAIMATAFLPVFYSHLALNDVPALTALTLSVYGSAGILRRNRLRDYAMAGVGLGLAVATKYTAAIVVLPLLVAFLSARSAADSPALRARAIRGLALAGGLGALAFLAADPHALLSFSESWSGIRRQQSAAGDLGKLGQTYGSGIHYYLWTLTWGVGWLPAIAAGAGATIHLAGAIGYRRGTRERSPSRFDVERVWFLVPWPLAFIVFMGVQDRYFGRWLLPALPALTLLAAFALVRSVDLVRSSPRTRMLLLVGGALALTAQGTVHSVHVDRVLSREDTRNEARAWMVRNVPAAAKVVIEPVVPEAWVTDPGRPTPITPSGKRWVKFLTTRTTLDPQGRKLPGGVGRTISVEEYERTTRPALVDSYARGGYCWVMIGSTQYGRALASPADVPRAIAYYRTLARRGRVVYRVDPYREGSGPVGFNFDWSFDYYPLAFERPGPTVIVYRLHEAACAA